MANMIEAMAKAGLIPAEKAKDESEAKHFRAVVKDLVNMAAYKPRVSKYKTRDIRAVQASHMRNPSVSGSVTAEARLRDAAGSDSGKKFNLSGPATPFGEPGRSTKVKR